MVVAMGEDGGVKNLSSFVLRNTNNLPRENLSTKGSSLVLSAESSRATTHLRNVHGLSSCITLYKYYF